MADELDDIFGAIDGGDDRNDDDNDDQSDVVIEGTDEAAGEQNKERPTTDDDEDTEQVGRDTKQLYNAIMYAPTASHLRDGPTHGPATDGSPNDEDRQKRHETAAATNEVNTGTSHDKSVRSYSAYPKNLPEGMELPTPKPPEKPAKEYPFALDPFQAQAGSYLIPFVYLLRVFCCNYHVSFLTPPYDHCLAYCFYVVGYIDKEESVLVAAHTSAGKTAVVRNKKCLSVVVVIIFESCYSCYNCGFKSPHKSSRCTICMYVSRYSFLCGVCDSQSIEQRPACGVHVSHQGPFKPKVP
jgi:hypothetical protein